MWIRRSKTSASNLRLLESWCWSSGSIAGIQGWSRDYRSPVWRDGWPGFSSFAVKELPKAWCTVISTSLTAAILMVPLSSLSLQIWTLINSLTPTWFLLLSLIRAVWWRRPGTNCQLQKVIFLSWRVVSESTDCQPRICREMSSQVFRTKGALSGRYQVRRAPSVDVPAEWPASVYNLQLFARS